MAFKSNLKTKLIRPVFLAVFCPVLLMTFLAVSYERKRCLDRELVKIRYQSVVIQNRAFYLMAHAEPGALKAYLYDMLAANSDILYFAFMDPDGKIIESSESFGKGDGKKDAATICDLSRPVQRTILTASGVTISDRFEIFRSCLNKDIFHDTVQRGKMDDSVFDAFLCIPNQNNQIFRLRLGFSALNLEHEQNQMLLAFFGGALFLLAAVFGLVYWRVKKAFYLFKGQVVSNGDQLENHRNNLEKMVEKKTGELSDLNRELAQQFEQRKEIEAWMLNVQKLEAVGTLAGGIAHEFNNLFMAIAGYASLIQKLIPENQAGADKAEKIKELVDKGSQSIKQLMGFARSGKYTLVRLNLNEIVRINLEMFGRIRKDITLELKAEKKLWHVYADKSQMEQVVMNLLLNAAEAMTGPGTIRVSTRNIRLHKRQVRKDKIMSGRFVLLCVSDEGKGIDNELIPRIFDPFFTTKHMSSGTGLGLSSVYGIVDNHGGFTTVESEKGRGTMFNIFLPAMKDKGGQENEQPV